MFKCSNCCFQKISFIFVRSVGIVIFDLSLIIIIKIAGIVVEISGLFFLFKIVSFNSLPSLFTKTINNCPFYHYIIFKVKGKDVFVVYQISTESIFLVIVNVVSDVSSLQFLNFLFIQIYYY